MRNKDSATSSTGSSRTGLVQCGSLPLSNCSVREGMAHAATMNPRSTAALSGKAPSRFRKGYTKHKPIVR